MGERWPVRASDGHTFELLVEAPERPHAALFFAPWLRRGRTSPEWPSSPARSLIIETGKGAVGFGSDARQSCFQLRGSCWATCRAIDSASVVPRRAP